MSFYTQTKSTLFKAISYMTTVLIVEDDPINVRVFSKILTKLGGLEVRHTENVDTVIKMPLQILALSLAQISHQ
jgi:CheY-like chemotaxis protein